MKRKAVLMSFLILVSGLSGCQTVRGFGQDLSNVGDAIMGN